MCRKFLCHGSYHVRIIPHTSHHSLEIKSPYPLWNPRQKILHNAPNVPEDCQNFDNWKVLQIQQGFHCKSSPLHWRCYLPSSLHMLISLKGKRACQIRPLHQISIPHHRLLHHYTGISLFHASIHYSSARHKHYHLSISQSRFHLL